MPNASPTSGGKPPKPRSRCILPEVTLKLCRRKLQNLIQQVDRTHSVPIFPPALALCRATYEALGRLPQSSLGSRFKAPLWGPLIICNNSSRSSKTNSPSQLCFTAHQHFYSASFHKVLIGNPSGGIGFPFYRREHRLKNRKAKALAGVRSVRQGPGAGGNLASGPRF